MTISTYRGVRFVLFFHDSAWVAHGLERGAVAQGMSREVAERRFRKTIDTYIRLNVEEGKDPFAGIKPAPAVVWKAAGLEQP